MSDNNTVIARGRPRAFAEADVLQRAAGLFLAHGFEALSYDAMAAELGLAKPSLYNAFGTKEALFARALAAYADGARTQILADFSGARDLGAAVRKLLHAAAAHYAGPKGTSRGCLLIGTSLPSCVTHVAPREILAHFIDRLEAGLASNIAAEHGAEAARRGKSPKALAITVSSLLFSLAVRARTGVSRRQLLATARDLASTMA